MTESSRGYREPESSSRDLMARYDMAHDRADRLPEVRAYLENLRPQILELQRRFRLQTQEDIDGLVRRDDLDMKDVEVLVNLINAFKSAWKENRISVTEARRYAGDLARRRAGPAFLEFARHARETVGDPDGSAREALAVVRATARAGESAIAWDFYHDVLYRLDDESSFAPKSTTRFDRIATTIAVAESFLGAGENSEQLLQESLTDWMDELNRGVDGADEILALSVLAERLALLYAKSDYMDHAIHLAKSIPNSRIKLDVYLELRRMAPTHVEMSQLLATYEAELSTRGGDRARYYFLTGHRAMGMAMLPDVPTSRDFGVLRECAAEYARAYDPERALTLLARAKSAGIMGSDVIGPMTVVFLQNGDVSRAESALSASRYSLQYLNPTEAAEIIVRLDALGSRDVSSSLLAPFARVTATASWEHSEAVRRVAIHLSETGGDDVAFLDLVRSRVRDISEPSVVATYQAAIREAETAIALRTFKRSALTFRPEGPDKPFDPAKFADAMDSIFADHRDIADKLRYDAPL